MKHLILVIPLWLWLASLALAQSSIPYPACGSGGSPTSCTLTIHVTASPTPIFGHRSDRTYLFLQNTGFTFGAGPPAINNNVVFCSIGSNNNPIAQSTTGVNVMVIEPGGVWEPEQIVKPQNSFTVPAGDVSCMAPFGDVWLAALEE